MPSIAHWIFLIFVILIIACLVFRRLPILPAVLGLFGVGLANSGNVIGAIQVVFRALILAAGNLLTVILLIGIVVGLTRLLKETAADQVIVKPLLKIKSFDFAFWLLGITMWALTLFIWPTPAITLLGAVAIPALVRTGISPIGLAVSLTIFGEGLGLAGDFVIQGAPSLLSKAAGVPVQMIVSESLPIVLISGGLAALVGRLCLHFFMLTKPVEQTDDYARIQTSIAAKDKNNGNINVSIDEKKTVRSNKAGIIAATVIVSYLLAVAFILVWKIRGDGASALIGGVTLLVLCLCTILYDGKGAFASFIEYVKEGVRFAMGVFTPIVIMSSFFFLGTKTGYQQILLHDGLGFFSDYAYQLSEWIPLTKWTVGILIVFVAILGSMDGSGFSSLPLVGGIAAALGEASGLDSVSLAVLGQVVGIWTGAALIPWGFTAVTAAVAGVEVRQLVKYTLPAYLSAVISAYLWTVLKI